MEFWGVLGLFLFLSTLFPGSGRDDFMERKPNNSALYQCFIFIVIKAWVKKKIKKLKKHQLTLSKVIPFENGKLFRTITNNREKFRQTA